jgi:hypothetical protein
MSLKYLLIFFSAIIRCLIGFIFLIIFWVYGFFIFIPLFILNILMNAEQHKLWDDYFKKQKEIINWSLELFYLFKSHSD